MIHSEEELIYGEQIYSVSIETFGPREAADALKMNDMNRPLSSSNIKLIAQTIDRGEWRLNGETVVFSDRDRLLQGQHRMHAVMRTGKPITTFVIRGVDEDSFSTFDMTKRRSGSDVLAINDESNSVKLSAAARAILTYTEPSAVCTNAKILEIVERFPRVRVWSDRYATSNARRFMPALFAGLMVIFEAEHGQDSAEAFFEQVSDGTGLEKNYPTLKLRERFMDRSRGTSIDFRTQTAFIIKAMNAFAAGKLLGVLKFASDESQPIISKRKQRS